MPIISFEHPIIDLDTIVRGDVYELVYVFYNIGDADLQIEMVSSCKCTDLAWTQDVIKPGEGGYITAIFDSKDQKLGDMEKIIDIIANTDPIVVEAVFRAVIIE